MKFQNLFIAFLVSCFFISVNADDQSNAKFRGEIQTKVESLQKQNDALSEKIDTLEKESKNVDNFKDIIDRQDQRIADINTGNTSFSLIIGLWAIVATFLSIAIPLFFAFKWKNEAMYEAKTAAHNEIDALKIELMQYVDQSKKQLHAISTMYDDYLLQKEKVENKNLDQLKQEVTDRHAVENALEYSKQKAEIYNNYESWMEAGIFAYKIDDYVSALDFWEKALNLTIDPLQTASALINKLAALKRLNRYDEAMEIVETVLSRYQSNPNPLIKNQVAKAFMEKGLQLEQRGKIEEAIQAYKQGIEFSPAFLPIYVNLFELQLITGVGFDPSLKNQFDQNAINDAEARLKFRMLQIVNESQKTDQSYQFSLLKEQFANESFKFWEWRQLDTWSNQIQDSATKERVQKTIQQFKNW